MTTVVLEHLQHANSASPDLTVGPDGNIGIGGVAAPSADLEIKPTGGDGELKITSDANGGNNMRLYQGYNSYINASNNVYISAGGNTDMFNLVNGKVGIGTGSPQHDLVVQNDNGPVISLIGHNYNDSMGIVFNGGDQSNASSNGNTGAKIMSQLSVNGGQVLGDLTFTTNSGDTFVNAMNIDTSGRVTTPYQPSFSSIKNTHQYPVSGSREIITPWTSKSNIGGHFNNSTGVFTAPVSGTYFFYISVMSDRNDGGDYQISIYKNGAMYVNSNDLHTANATYVQTTVPVVINLSANDTVDYRLYNSSSTSTFIYQGSYTHCGGYLIG